MKTVKFLAVAVGVTLGATCVYSTLALADTHLGDQVSGDLKLTAEEMAALEPVLAHYYAMDGSKPILQKVVNDATNCGCRGTCIADLVELMNRAMKAGVSNEEAGEEVISAIKAVDNRCKQRGIDASPQDISRAVKARMEARFRERNIVF